MARTNSAAVIDILGRDYDSSNSPSLTGYIDSASLMIDNVVACATRKGKTQSTAELELLERWVAACLYGMSDKPFSSKSTSGASGAFAGQTGQGLDANLYGQTAQNLDSSGCLRNIQKQQVAGGSWLGKPPSEQIDYENRD